MEVLVGYLIICHPKSTFKQSLLEFSLHICHRREILATYLPFCPTWHAKSPFHAVFTAWNDSFALLSLLQSPLLLPPTTRVGPTRQGRLQPFVYVAGSRCSAEASAPPFLMPSSPPGRRRLEAEKVGRGELRPRGGWDRAPPRSVARSVR
jgi:hypothetical protein